MPTVRLTLRMGSSRCTGRASSSAPSHSCDQRLVERPVEPVVLGRDAQQRVAVGDRRHLEDRREVEARRLPVLDGCGGVEHLGVPDRLGDRAEPERREVLAHLLGDVLEERDDELGLAAEPLAQLGVLRRDTDRTRVEMADAHHHAARHHERCGREAELLGAEQRRDHDVAAGLQLAVDLHDDAVAQTVHEQRLLGLGEAELPRRARVLERREGARTRAAVVARDQHDIRVRLRHARGDRADPDLGDELHVARAPAGSRS